MPEHLEDASGAMHVLPASISSQCSCCQQLVDETVATRMWTMVAGVMMACGRTAAGVGLRLAHPLLQKHRPRLLLPRPRRRPHHLRRQTLAGKPGLRAALGHCYDGLANASLITHACTEYMRSHMNMHTFSARHCRFHQWQVRSCPIHAPHTSCNRTWHSQTARTLMCEHYPNVAGYVMQVAGPAIVLHRVGP